MLRSLTNALRHNVAGLTRTNAPIGRNSFPAGATAVAGRGFLNFKLPQPHDFELPADTMPLDIKGVMAKKPEQLDFYENYWYWKLRGESVIVDPEGLPKKSYKQLARDLGLAQVNEPAEHMVGLLELYEYLKQAPFLGPFGTVENPVLCPSLNNMRVVGCTGGTGDNEHVPLWFNCREGFLYRCGECDQVFMLVRVLYSVPDGSNPFPVDPEVKDTFDWELLERGHKMWNSGDYNLWPDGEYAYNNVPELVAAFDSGLLTDEQYENAINYRIKWDSSKGPEQIPGPRVQQIQK
eukprot:GDKI01024922.1.p1 GENE.GDKI01024922.1~~GDKI01024922.1.p1  ORF type:complete len:293 (+),score=89.97 GDKI01024922.1:66-944(+)